ncbi:MAG: HNH endonuclease [Lachnospiraceae bacterium]|nr:HNH endonuclease [Lachnospiraceae bacterium]
MIRFERKKTEKSEKAVESLLKAKNAHSSYNTPDVIAALREVFHGKCYICENKEITSYQIEHLYPHHGNDDLKYDWNNLFLSCAHCNNTKLAKYDPILDCTKEDIDAVIAFRKTGYFGIEEKLIFQELDSREETHNTAELLRDIYYGSTPQKILEATILRKRLRKELSAFKEYVREYYEADGEDKDDLRCLIERELEDSSAFTAFKRWLIKDHKDSFPEFANILPGICHPKSALH